MHKIIDVDLGICDATGWKIDLSLTGTKFNTFILQGSGYPSFYAVLFYEVIAIGLAEAYRTGLLPPVVEVEQVGNPLPGTQREHGSSCSS